MKVVVRALRELYADLPAAEFGPQKLKVVRQRMIEAGLCQSLIRAVSELI